MGEDNELTEEVCDLWVEKFGSALPLFCTNPPSASLLYSADDSKKFKISYGEKITGTFYESSSLFYSGSDNPLNTDGTYKRLVYNAIKSQFYEFSNPEHKFGIETIDFDKFGKRKEVRKIYDTVTVGTVPKELYGESIHPGSVKIIDKSNPDEVYTIADDGYTNLVMTDKYFQSEVNVRPLTNEEHHANDRHLTIYPTESFNPLNERFGEEVDYTDGYLLVGCPDDSGSLTHPKAGWAHLMKYDVSESIFRSLKTLYSPWSQHSIALQIATDDSWLLEMEQGGYVVTSNEPSPFTSEDDKFGSAISIEGQFMAIGSPNVECLSGSRSGTVFVFDKYKGGIDHWGTINVLESEVTDDEFGFAVKINNNVLAVGAPGYNNDAGAVYIYQRKTYNHETDPCLDIATGSFYQPVSPEDSYFFPLTNSFCASEFILEDTDATIFMETDPPTYVSGTNTFVLHARLVAPDPKENERFGGSLDMDGDILVIGNDKRQQHGGGKVYVYRFVGEEVEISGSSCVSGSWLPACKMDKNYSITASIEVPKYIGENVGDSYGHSVAVDGEYVIVGSPTFGTVTLVSQSFNIGAVYAYEAGDPPEDLFYCGNCCDDDIETVECGVKFADRFMFQGDTLRNNWFGKSVDIENNRFVVGCPIEKTFVTASYDGTGSYSIEDYEVETDAGKLFVYNLDDDLNWQLEKNFTKRKLINRSTQQFGNSVKITDQYIFVGAPSHVNEDYDTSISHSSEYFQLETLKSGMPMKASGSVFIYNTPDLNNYYKVGNVFYKNGIMTITDTGSFFGEIFTATGSRGHIVNFKGEHTLYENEFLIPVEKGEFNISTNPSALVKEKVILDINGDGIFDFDDLDLILRYLNKFKFLPEDQTSTDNGYVQEQTEAWWNNDIIITEAEDALVLNGYETNVLQEEFELDGGKLDADTYDKLVALDNAGYLDFDGDGKADNYDANILLNYWSNLRDERLIEGNINDNSTRNTPDLVVNYLDKLTGKFNLTQVDPTFYNYLESSSIDKTGSYQSPYVTSIGLYNENYEMVAVAKLGKPIKVLQNDPLNFIVRIDM
jgi:hypothetical protein